MTDLLLTAGFDDQTEQFFQRLEDNFSKMGGLSDQANDQVSSGAGKSAVKLGLLAGAVGGVTAKLTEMAVSALQAFPAFIKQSIQIAAQSEQAGVALGVVAENAGYTADEVNNLKQEMIDMGIAEDTAVDTLLKMAGAELDLNEAIKLANVALDASTVAGRSEEEVLRRTTHAIVTKNREMLADLQLGIDREGLTKAYAKSQNIAVTAISERGKKEIFLNGVIDAGNKLAGARDKAMGTGAKKAQIMEESIHNLQKALGDVFLPSYTLAIGEMSQAIANLSEWVNENSDSLTDLAQILGVFVSWLFGAVKAALAFLGAMLKLTTGIESAGDVFTLVGEKLVTLIYGEEEAAKRMENLGTTAKQAMVLLVASFTAGVGVVEQFVVLLGNAVNVVSEFYKMSTGKGTIEDVNKSVENMSDTWENFSDNVMEKTRIATENTMKSLGMIEDEAVPSVKKTEKAIDELGNALEEAENKVIELNKAFAEEMAEIAKRRSRAAIDQAIRESRQREDIERRHQERIEDIIANAQDRRREVLQDSDKEIAALADEQAEQRASLERDKGERLIDIEIDYRRRLADIQRDYLFSVDEAARKNDAVAILRLMRENTKKLQEEDMSRNRNKKDAQVDYEGQLVDLKRSQDDRRKEIQRDRVERLAELSAELEESLRKAEDARLKDYENLDRSLSRQREDRLRHQAWEDEDRAAAHEAELRELGSHFSGIEGATRAHFEALLAEHGAAITGLDVMWDEYMQRQTGRATAMPPTGRGWGMAPVDIQDTATQEWEDMGFGGAPSDEWQFAGGGAAVVSKPTNVLIGEGGPEAMFAMPLSGMQQHHLGGNLDVNVHGVSAQMEQQIAPVIYEILEGLFANMN